MKVKFLLLLVSVLFLSSCNGTDDDFKMKGEPHEYKVVFEATGTDYWAEASVLNTDNVSLYDETDSKDLKQPNISEEFCILARPPMSFSRYPGQSGGFRCTWDYYEQIRCQPDDDGV